MSDKNIKSNEYWKDKLTPEQFEVCRLKGTERPFSGEYNHNKSEGIYSCVCCGAELFTSSTKYDSGSGWPSFFEPIAGKVSLRADNAHGMQRTEVVCSQCDSHLGHVFDDGPAPTHQRYCMNSVALQFKSK